MIADDVWQNQSQIFWNYVRIISENLGYSRNGKVLRHSEADIRRALTILNLSVDIDATIDQLAQYFHFRANLIETTMATYLQTPDEARMLFEEVVAHYTTSVTSRFNQGGQENARVYTVKNGVPVIAPYNKQKGHKREIDYLTAISNILISHHLAGEDFDRDPHRLPIVTESGIIQGAMSRRMEPIHHALIPWRSGNLKITTIRRLLGQKLAMLFTSLVWMDMNAMRFLIILQGGYIQHYSSMLIRHG